MTPCSFPREVALGTASGKHSSTRFRRMRAGGAPLRSVNSRISSPALNTGRRRRAELSQILSGRDQFFFPRPVSATRDAWIWIALLQLQITPNTQSISRTVQSASTILERAYSINRPTEPGGISKFRGVSDNLLAHHANHACSCLKVNSTGQGPIRYRRAV